VLNRRTLLHAGLLATVLTRRTTAEEVPVCTFGPYATAEAITAGVDLSGKTIVVTGCNSGIGYETMRVLSLRGAHLIGTARSGEKGREACARVVGRAEPVVMELSDFDSVVSCAEQIESMDVPIDVLICNAGVLLNRAAQIGQLELQFVVNHLGHFILANRLMHRIVAAPQGRVVVVGSVSHWDAPPGGIQFDNLSGEGWSEAAYAHSKLANGLFSLQLSRRLNGTKATSNCLHPGGVRTNILRDFDELPYDGPYRFKTPEEGAATSCYLASSLRLARITGQYFEDCNVAPQGPYQTDLAMAERLWVVSEELTAPYLS
jgi:NAD(P)-dependent dehydrogenase (short-subunit alcohol dehydrogenase family)